MLLLVVLGGGRLPGTGDQLLNVKFDPHAFPVAAAGQLAEHGLPQGNGFTTYTWGSYLDYALPAYHPFVDSRSDTYGREILQQYLDIVGLSPDWRSLLAHYHILWALLPTGEPLAQVLALSPGWRCEPADSTGVAVLCRQEIGWIPVNGVGGTAAFLLVDLDRHAHRVLAIGKAGHLQLL
jgi:hypothetical protein